MYSNFWSLQDEIDAVPILTVPLEKNTHMKRILSEKVLGILPIKGMVLFPGMVLPIAINREKSIALIKEANSNKQLIGIVTQKNHDVEEPKEEDFFSVGTVAIIHRLLRMPDGTATVIIQGMSRFVISELVQEEPYFKANIKHLKDIASKDSEEFEAMIASLRDMTNKIIELSSSIPADAASWLRNIEDPVFLMHLIAGHIAQDMEQKQLLLSENNLMERGVTLLRLLQKELQFLELKNEVASKTKQEIDKQQKEYFLQQQLKSIREELGMVNTDNVDIEKMREQAKGKKWSKEAEEFFAKGILRLEKLYANRAEYSVEHSQLQLLLDLPWGEYSTDNHELTRAEKILNKEHFGMKQIKERILEYISVLFLTQNMRAPILCLAGPPGVGKTSFAKSIAHSLGREFVKISLGGVHDESEIRGHRKTYIGAMPGRLIQSLKKSKVANPLILLDEIDKIGSGSFNGNVSNALLEVLDPEQNKHFYDNYLEVSFDLSKVLFIATANEIANIQAPLRDRLEIIQLSGYSLEEKLSIARKHLIPKQLKLHGIASKQYKISVPVLKAIITNYTRETGVRELERVLAKTMRYVARNYILTEQEIEPLALESLTKVLGKPKYSKETYTAIKSPGVAVGLAWTPVGGDILFIETLANDSDKESVQITGNLGAVMKESVIIALSYLRANASKYRIKLQSLNKKAIHIHVPEGAVPKDGPSAGVTLITALSSMFLKRPVRSHLAMTGEITLRGEVLPVGGISEKVLAAKRAGIKKVLLPKDNEKDIQEIDPSYLKGLQFHFVERVDEVLNLALGI